MAVEFKNRSSNNDGNQDGQSLFEFIVFFPFFVLLLISLLKFGSSINGSINQQKAVRSYFFYLIKNNSTLPLLKDLAEYRDDHNFNQVENSRISFTALGWREKEQSLHSYAPCYELSSFTQASPSTEICDAPVISSSSTTRLIRIYTVFGLCSGSYVLNGNSEWVEDFTEFRSSCIKSKPN